MFRWVPLNRIVIVLITTCCLGVLPAPGQQTLAQARQQLQQGNTAGALQILKTYQNQHPDDPNVYNLLGMAYAGTGELDHSLAMFKKFAQLAPQKPEAYNNLGATYLRLGEASQAEGAFRHSLSLQPGNVDALYNLGVLLNSRNKYKAALPFLRRAYSSQHSSEVVYQLAVAVAGTGDRASALKLLNSSSPPSGAAGVPWLQLLGVLAMSEGDLTVAEKALREAVRLAPDDHKTLYALAVVLLRSNHTDEGVPMLEKSLDSLPPGERYVRAGNVLAAHGDYDGAIREFERAAKEDPESYDAFYNLAVMRLEKIKDLIGAYQAAERALSLQPSGEIHNLIADIYEARHDYKQALDHYQVAVRLAPESEKYIFDLGIEFILHEDYGAAQKVFRVAQERFPKSARIQLGIGAAEFIGGSHADSVAAFLSAVDADPTYKPAYMFLGAAASFAGSRLPQVLQKLAQIAQMEPKNFEIQYYYGAALVTEMDRTGNLESATRALTVLRRASSIRPGDARTFYQIGEVARLRHQNDEAGRLYEKAVSLDPDYTVALYKLAQLYARQGRKEEAQRLFAMQEAATAKEKQRLYHRTSAIESFILQVRNENNAEDK
jgi:tetratricopeptide (TPR) repeat protein